MGTLSLAAPLVLFEKSRLWAGTRFHFSLPFIIIPHNTITLHKQLHIQSSLPQLSPVHYTDTRPTRNVICPSSAWSENRPRSMPSICLAWNPKHLIVQWVGVGTHTHTYTHTVFLFWKILKYKVQNFFSQTLEILQKKSYMINITIMLRRIQINF